MLCLLLLLTLPLSALGEMSFPSDTEGERLLADYIARVNEDLAAVHAAQVNSLFLCFPTTASLGVTDQDDAEVPEKVELDITMYDDALNVLTLRCQDPDQFAQLAAACIHAAAPEGITWAEALKAAQIYADRVKKAPNKSFADTVNEQNGEAVRTYYAYYFDRYGDEVNWLQLTLIFPMAGALGGEISVTPAPDVTAAPTDEYEGIRTDDSYDHFQVFTTATPEPDSPAAEDYPH